MKPKPSCLLLKNSFVTELRFSANPKFKPREKTLLEFEDLQIESTARQPSNDSKDWQVCLQISYAGKDKCNVPYSFRIVMFGYFGVAKDVPADEVEKFVQVNGSSVLFSSAREILKCAMANGPFSQIVLPAVSFFEQSKK